MLSGFNPYFTGSNSGSCFHNSVFFDYYYCFNPYFTGSNSGSKFDNFGRYESSRFNPYFTGSNSGRFRKSQTRGFRKWFQSLFYWK